MRGPYQSILGMACLAAFSGAVHGQPAWLGRIHAAECGTVRQLAIGAQNLREVDQANASADTSLTATQTTPSDRKDETPGTKKKSKKKKKRDVEKDESPAPADDERPPKVAKPESADAADKGAEKLPKALATWIKQVPPGVGSKHYAIAQITDQNRLAKLAVEDLDKLARRTAAHVLADQPLLAKVAGESDDAEVRNIAAERITGEDQPSLIKLIETMEHAEIRNKVVPKVQDPALRAKFQRVAFTPGIALKTQTYTGKLAWKAYESNEPTTRLRAIVGNDDTPLLIKAALEDSTPRVSAAAAKRLLEIRDGGKSVADDVFEKIAVEAKTAAARRLAVGVVSNQDVLAKAAEDSRDQIRAAAAERIDRPAVLARLAGDPLANVRFAAIQRLTDRVILQKMADSDDDPLVRWRAKKRLSNADSD